MSAMTAFIPKKGQKPAGLPPAEPLPKSLRRDPPMTDDPLEQLGAQLKRDEVIVHTDDDGPVRVDRTKPPSRDAQIAAAMDETLVRYAHDVRQTAVTVAAAFDALVADITSQNAVIRTYLDGAHSSVGEVLKECQHVAEVLERTGARMKAQHEEFMIGTRNAMVAVVNVKHAIGNGGVASRSDDEVALDLVRECVARIERVAPKAEIAARLRSALTPEPKNEPASPPAVEAGQSASEGK